jgi:RNA polymerase sigma-70 factor (ECF subfamily)
MTEADEELIARMAARDESALAELYRRYAPYIRAMARRMLMDNDLVHECVQDAFVQAWKAAGRFDAGKASGKTWLVTIAHRLALNALRDRPPENLTLEDWDGPSEAPDPIDRILVERAMGRLRKEERELLELAFFRGYSHTELAQLLGQPLGSVKTRLRSALAQLRESLEVHHGY